MISIIIPAYQSEDFIEECLNSIKNQTFFIEHSDYEILLGIDACVKTLHKAAVISHNYENLKIFYFNQNVGPYVIKNTLTDYTKYDNILFFDSDDIMEPFLVERALTNFTEHDIARFTFANFTDDVSVKTTGRLADGVFLIKKGKFNDVGGFLPWRCAADTDFHERIIRNNFKTNIILTDLFLRRIHPNNLTSNPSTGFGSPIRANYKQQIDDAKKHHILTVNKSTTSNLIVL